MVAFPRLVLEAIHCQGVLALPTIHGQGYPIKRVHIYICFSQHACDAFAILSGALICLGKVVLG